MRRLEIHVPEDVYGQLLQMRKSGHGRSISEVARGLLQGAIEDRAERDFGGRGVPQQEIAWRSYAVLLKLEYLYEQAIAERGPSGERTLAKARAAVREAMLATQECES